jgi:hypothetical protein
MGYPSLRVILIWKFSALSVLFQSTFVETKLSNLLPADLFQNFKENTTWDFVLFYQKIINKISPKFSPI